MKIRLYIIIIICCIVSSCDPYYVEANFPIEDFYSYAPYHQGDTLTFVNQSDCDTIRLQVSLCEEYYQRGKRACKCGKEEVTKYAVLTNDTVQLKLWIDCIDRAIFSIGLKSSQALQINALYEVDYSQTENIWAKTYDETKIFKAFEEELILSQENRPIAQIKKGQGLLWLVDSKNNNWVLCND
ncbi:MAG: hypothetical protein II928_00855 [Paludibacteraceae bacterium]|nr:hypothetical protein [Paludibacteraceae bacterium]